MAQETDIELLPLRMLNEYAYCPRLFHLMQVEGRWEDNAYTLDGKFVHRRVDAFDQVLPHAETAKEKAEAAKGDEPPIIVRSVPLACDELGITGKLDLASCDPEGGEAIPVETKRGKVPQNAEQSYEPERVQLMAQGLLLRRQGYKSQHGYLYFAASRRRVRIDFSPELEARTLELIVLARAALQAQKIPDPLDDSPKCWGCSLNAICLPDETLALRQVPEDPVAPTVRRLYPPREDATPFYVQEQGAKVGKSGEVLVVEKSGEKLGQARLKDVSQLCLMGNVQISTQTIHLLCEAGIPVVYLSTGGWFYGISQGLGLKNAFDRAAQFQVCQDDARCLLLAKELVSSKVNNQRAFLMRNAVPRTAAVEASLEEMAAVQRPIDRCDSASSLLGLEGTAAAAYFRSFAALLKPRDGDIAWDFNDRNRRPPRDPVNALLSFTYALLTKECTTALQAEGLDPWWGFYHRPKHGKPALALDLMEPFRPTIADSAVISAINTGMLGLADFERGAGACVMKPEARKAIIRAYESRLDQLVTLPAFDYRCSWRAAIRLQARLLARYFRGDIPRWECPRIR